MTNGEIKNLLNKFENRYLGGKDEKLKKPIRELLETPAGYLLIGGISEFFERELKSLR